MSTTARSLDRAVLPRRSREGPYAVVVKATSVTAVIAGGLLALTGFNPLNTAADRLGVATQPVLVVLTPGVLVAVAIVIAAWAAGARGWAMLRVPRLWALGILLVLNAGLVSALGSARPWYSLALAASGFLAPTLVFLAVRPGVLPVQGLAAGFLGAITIVLLRADVAYVHLYGVPTSQSLLFATKFVSLPYDFHYYTLGNPDSTAGFLLLPFALALFWCISRSTPRTTRLWLLAPLVVMAFTFLLLYVRFEGLIVLAMLIAGLLCSPLPVRLRQAIGAAALLAGLAVALLSPGHYLLDLFSSGHNSSGAVRLHSLRLGWHTFIQHPLTGVGLGNFGERSSQLPAHSSILEAGAESGILGLLGLTLATVGVTAGAIGHIRRHGLAGLRSGAWIGIGSYVVVCALSGVAAEAAMVNFVSVYGLAFALLAGLALSETREPSAGGTLRMFPRHWVPVRWWTRHTRVATLGLLTLLGAAVIVGARIVNRAPSTHDFTKLEQGYGLSRSTVWNFSAVPSSWHAGTGRLQLRHSGTGSLLTTTPRYAAYVVYSPLLSVMPGHYEVVARGRVLRGGLSLGVLDANARRWIQSGLYPAARRSGGSYPMPIRFSVRRNSGIRIVLSNGAAVGRSEWLLDSVTLRPLQMTRSNG